MLSHHRMPGHQFIQLFVGQVLSKPGEQAEQAEQIIIRLNTVGFCCLYQRIDYSAGIRSLDRVAEQPVFPSDHKGPDRILCQIV